jgi:Sulfotransferase family
VPMQGYVDILSRTRIAGWAANSDRPEEEVAVRIIIDGKSVRGVANLEHPMLISRPPFPNATGRYRFRFEGHPLPLSPFTDHQIEVVFANTGAPVPGGSDRIPAAGAAGSATGRRPVVLTSTGRAGSSLLMARLAQHPDILVAGDHPHEILFLSYYTRVFCTLVFESDRERSTKPDTMFAPSARFFIGFNPNHLPPPLRDSEMRRYWRETAPAILRQTCTDLINAYYDAVAQKTGKPSATHFVEKIGTNAIVREAANFMFGPVDEIVLVRDPRDIICSSKQFWRTEFSDSIRNLRGQYGVMSHPAIEAGARRHVMHYEMLVTQPEATMRDLFAFLRVSDFDLQIDKEKESRVFRSHGTSQSPEATIGRWRKELTADEVRTATNELRAFIEHFGYPTELEEIQK